VPFLNSAEPLNLGIPQCFS